jgi:hypothetical protein
MSPLKTAYATSANFIDLVSDMVTIDRLAFPTPAARAGGGKVT